MTKWCLIWILYLVKQLESKEIKKVNFGHLFCWICPRWNIAQLEKSPSSMSRLSTWMSMLDSQGYNSPSSYLLGFFIILKIKEKTNCAHRKKSLKPEKKNLKSMLDRSWRNVVHWTRLIPLYKWVSGCLPKWQGWASSRTLLRLQAFITCVSSQAIVRTPIHRYLLLTHFCRAHPIELLNPITLKP